MATDDFFSIQREQSQIKSLIVSKYFHVWAEIMLSHRRMGDPTRLNKNIHYVELFCGPGVYDDGTPSTPLMVLRSAIANKKIAQYLIAEFTDRDEAYCSRLEKEIQNLPGIGAMRHPPRVACQEVDKTLADLFEQLRMVPTLLFVDPWGYKGLSLSLLESVLKDPGSECVFFLNYNRINAAINNPAVAPHVDGLFGQVLANRLRGEVAGRSPAEREEIILRYLYEGCGAGDRYVQAFCFRKPDGSRTSHYLVFVTKHFLGYDKMREVMAKYSSSEAQGVPSFRYDPNDKRSPRLLEVDRPLDDLKDMLLRDLAGKTVTVETIYATHSVNRPYIRRNYKQALRELYEEGKISTNRAPARRDSFANDILVTVP